MGKVTIFTIFKVLIFLSLPYYIFFLFSSEVTDFSLKKRDFKIYLKFDYGVGIEKRVPIILSGIQIGEVISKKLVKIDNKTELLVEIKLDKKYQSILTDRGKFYITRRKFIGATFIQFEPNLKGKKVKYGEILRGESAIKYFILFNKLEYFNQYLSKIFKIGKDNGLLEKFKILKVEIEQYDKILKNDVPKISKKSKILKNSLDKNIKKLNRFKGIENRLKKSIILAKNLINKGEIKGRNIVFSIDDLIDGFETIQIESIVFKNQLIQSLKGSLKKVKNISKMVEKDIQMIQNMVYYINDGMGNIGLFLENKDIYDYLRFLMIISQQESYYYLIPKDR